MHVCACVCVCACVRACMHACMRAYMRACMCVCACKCYGLQNIRDKFVPFYVLGASSKLFDHLF